MPVELKRVEKDDLTILKLTGKILVQEVKEAILSFYHKNPTRFVLWDTRDGDISHLSEHNIRHLVQTATRLLPTKENGRTAIIATEELSINISSMAEVFSGVFRQDNPIKVFFGQEEAYQWLFEKRE